MIFALMKWLSDLTGNKLTPVPSAGATGQARQAFHWVKI
jgi:hypothetical protein